MIVTVQEAIGLLQQGQVVALPTETVYGLAADITNDQALARVFSTKSRPFFDPLIVHISDLEQISPLVELVPDSLLVLAQHFWPGPLTVVLKKSPKVSALITSGQDSVGLRMPNHLLAQQVIRAVGPLAAPSANRFGKTSPTRAEHVEKEFQGQVAVLDGGPCLVGIESTVIRLTETEDQVEIDILRPGSLSAEDLIGVMKSFSKPCKVQRVTSPIAPGQLQNHYQPEAPLVLSQGVSWSEQIHNQVLKSLAKDFQSPKSVWRFSSDDPALAARSLYEEMRQRSTQSEKDGSYIFFETPQDFSAPRWEALRDRLEKAATAFMTHHEGQVSISCKK